MYLIKLVGRCIFGKKFRFKRFKLAYVYAAKVNKIFCTTFLSIVLLKETLKTF